MRQVHNINESYESYHHRKYGVFNGLILSGIFTFAMGMFAFNFARENNTGQDFMFVGMGVILLGVILFIIGIWLRFSRRHK